MPYGGMHRDRRSPDTVDVLVVGCGPAGASLALNLYARDPRWAQRVLLVDKAVHPREKLCGGAISWAGEDLLARVGVSLEATDNLPIREVRFVYRDQQLSFFGDPVARIVHRAAFDHWMVERVRERGFEVRQGEAVLGITERADHVAVETDRQRYRARVLVAADGSKSTVRRLLRWPGAPGVARLLEVLTDERPARCPEFAEQRCVVDLSRAAEGLQGYTWAFPSFVRGEPKMNRGIFDSRTVAARPRADLRRMLAGELSHSGADLGALRLQGHPIRWFDPQIPLSRPRVLLTGDAAGVDAMLGEGIAFCFAYGRAVARVLERAFARSDFRFTGYRRAVLGSLGLWQLPLRTAAARRLYRPLDPRAVRRIFRAGRAALHISPFRSGRFAPERGRLG